MFKLIIEILWLVFFIWAVIDIINAHRDFGWKILWAIVCLIFPVIGVVLYYFFGHPKNTMPPSTPAAPTGTPPAQM